MRSRRPPTPPSGRDARRVTRRPPFPWDPEHDPLIPFPYRASDFQNKRLNKERLLQAFELPEELSVPLVGMVSPALDEEGTRLVARAVERGLVALRFVMVGAGNGRRGSALHDLARGHPDRVGLHRGSSEPLERLVHAGSDVLVLPRETPAPAELARAYRYGCVPAVLGGAWGVKDFEPISGRGDGYVVKDATPDAFAAVWSRIAADYGRQRAFKKLVSKIMRSRRR